ncbi:MAG: hypothetical protein A2Z68_01610 [Candidatus Nealsonbacteria bacterium RBG_13_38_11]|uniref:Homing endonuclease LAGLIDADG domain-containing protein n=1 Tax=Candidatus Nealsonbacteria bacterium RBG_13_38_11 TaxID=1801662 RepID=A0A1G2E0H0_9BACT|nr:MAG: hypothetical protein A2Z68_01610 [Candidatus Nealsonbacteria bacterium RBG_13_38_11]HXK32373.1 hypothetical protein [Candidatus Paceibacterota bacterium]
MKWSIAEEKKIKKLYCQTKLSLEEIARMTGRSVAALNNRLTKLKVKRRKPLKFKYPSKITPALARIHAHLSGDGNLYHSKEKDCYGPWARYRKNLYRTKYYLVYNNNYQALLNEFWQDIFSTFGIRGKKSEKNRIRVTSKKAYELLKRLGAGGSFVWKIPKEITGSSNAIMKNWIRAFFDDEADFDDDGRIRVKCVNKKGLIQLLKMLRKFVPCHLTPKKGFYWGKTVCININKKDSPKFFSKIGSLRAGKIQRINAIK